MDDVLMGEKDTMLDSLAKKYRDELDIVIEGGGVGQSLHDHLAAEQEKHFPVLLGRNRVRDVDWTEEQHVAHATQHLMGGVSLLERGYAKRIVEDRPEELARAASTYARLQFWWGARDECGLLGNTNDLLKALAAGDVGLLHRYTEVTPGKGDAGPRAVTLLRAGVTAVISRDQQRIAEAIADFDSWKKPKRYIECIFAALKGLAHSDPATVSLGLDSLIEMCRKIPQDCELFKFICLEPHGLYELCRWYDAALVSQFNPDRGVPWDGGLHEWVRRNEGKSPHYDLESLSPELQDWLVQLPFRDELAHHWPADERER